MENSQSGQTMHKELKVVDAAAFSVGLIGPVGAIALLGTGAAAIIGRGVTLSFVFATVGVALVAGRPDHDLRGAWTRGHRRDRPPAGRPASSGR
jgi:hypothetical protein